MNEYIRQVLKETAKSILLYLSFVRPYGTEDVLTSKKYEPVITIDDEISLKIEKIEILLSIGNIHPVNIEYVVMYKGKKIYSCKYNIIVNSSKCFWSSTINEVRAKQFVGVKSGINRRIEGWTNKQFVQHHKETHHTASTNNKDSL